MDCQRCVLLEPGPVCKYCLEYDKREKERQAMKLHPGLPMVLHKIRTEGEGKDYDCLIGLSGGVDSATVLHKMVTEHGLRPLCFSVDNGWNDPRADENILRMVEKLKVPFYRYTIDLKEFCDLQMAFVRAGVKNLEIPTDHVLMATTYEMASKYGIKYIISGGNMSTEGIMPENYGYNARDLTHIKAIFKRFMGRRLKGLPTISLPKYLWYRFVKGITIVQPLDFYEYNREEAKRELEKEYGWKDYGEKHGESIYTRWFQNFYLPKKFNLDKRRPHLSSMINSGQITRAQALEELKKPLEYPELGCEEKVLSYKVHDHFEYPTNQWIWDGLSKIYACFR